MKKYWLFTCFACSIIFPINSILRIIEESGTNIDYINIHVQEGTRTKRSADDSLHPETYNLDIPLPASAVRLRLTRNDNFGTSVPTLTIQRGSLRIRELNDPDYSIFYQDPKQGALFVMQYNGLRFDNVFGTFSVQGQGYVVQNIRNASSSSLKTGLNTFEIRKERIPEVEVHNFVGDSFKRRNMTKNEFHRYKIATGEHKLELLIVVDYAVYKFWYDKGTKTTAAEKESDALGSIRQFYAFIINGMDGMYKNIQTTSFSISIVFAGIVIAQNALDASWTESIKIASVTPNQVDSLNALSNFQSWNRAASNLPGHDHAMLFTRYDLTANGSTSNAENVASNNLKFVLALYNRLKYLKGLAYLNAVCTSSSQSIVEDRFNFIMITVASRLLGYCLGARDDGDGNDCSFNDAYIMAALSSPQQNAATATHPWIFSTTYFTNYINSLDTGNKNCMKSLSSGFDPTALSPYNQNKTGQVYTTDQQCAFILGDGSYFCSSLYSGNYSTLCTVMWCSDVTRNGICMSEVAGNGTLCGNKKWCISDVCTYDASAPTGDDICLYGDVKGAIFINGWTCADMVREVPNNCVNAPTEWCASCAYYTKTSATEAKTTTQPLTTTTTQASTTKTTQAPSTTQATTKTSQAVKTTTSQATSTTSHLPITTYKPATDEYKLRCQLKINFNVSISLSDINTQGYQDLFSLTEKALTNYYRTSMSLGKLFRRIILYRISIGSLIVDHDIVTGNMSSGNIIAAVNDLVNGNTTLTIENGLNAQTARVISATISNNENTTNLNRGDDSCKIFLQLENCSENYECRLNSTDNSAHCSLRTVYSLGKVIWFNISQKINNED